MAFLFSEKGRENIDEEVKGGGEGKGIEKKERKERIR